jgi:hypothetical protein
MDKQMPAIPSLQAAPTLATDFTDEHGVHMKLIPAGEFQMGSDKSLTAPEESFRLKRIITFRLRLDFSLSGAIIIIKVS